MPVMRETFAEQDQVAGREGADGITDEARALPRREKG